MEKANIFDLSPRNTHILMDRALLERILLTNMSFFVEIEPLKLQRIRHRLKRNMLNQISETFLNSNNALLALNICRDFTAMPPSIRDEKQQNKVREVALSTFGPNQKVWLNWKDQYWWDIRQHRTNILEWGPHPYENWATGQPTTSMLSECAYMNTTSGKWYSSPCSDINNVLCEMDQFFWWSARENCWHTEAGKRFTGPITTNVTTKNVKECGRMCQRSLQCMSANYNMMTKQCELMPRKADNHKTEIVDDVDSYLIDRYLNTHLYH